MPDLNANLADLPAPSADLNAALAPPQEQPQSQEPILPPVQKHYIGSMNADLDLSGRTNADDGDIVKFAADRSNAYAASLKQQFPGLSDEQAQSATQAYRQDLAERAQGQRLRQSVRDNMNYLQSGYTLRRATGQDFANILPGGRHLAGIAEAVQLKNASERLQSGAATPEDYDIIGQHLARQQYDADVRRRAGQGSAGAITQSVVDIGTQLPAEVAEWMAFGGPVGKAGEAAGGLAERAGAGALGQATANFVGRLATRQLLTSYRNIPSVVQGMSPSVNLDDQGKVVTQEGPGGQKAFDQAWKTQLATNAAFEFSGALDPKTGFSAANIALSTGKAIAAIQSAKALGYYTGGGGHGDVFTEVANQKTWEGKREALVHFGIESGVFAALETVMHARGENGEIADPAKVVEGQSADPAKVVEGMRVRLQQEGVPEDAWGKYIAGMMSEMKSKADAAKQQQASAVDEGKPVTQPANVPENQITPSTPLTGSVKIVPDTSPDAPPTTAPAPEAVAPDDAQLGMMRSLLKITKGVDKSSVDDMTPDEVRDAFKQHHGTAELLTPNEPVPQKAATYEPVPTVPDHISDAIKSVLPDAAETGRTGEMRAEIGNRALYLTHDFSDNSVRVDFTRTSAEPLSSESQSTKRPGVGASVEPGSMQLAVKLKNLVAKLKDTGVNIKYAAIGGREAVYERALTKAGYEMLRQPGNGSNEYVWRPKAETLPPQSVDPDWKSAYDNQFSKSKMNGLTDGAADQKAREWADFVKPPSPEVMKSAEPLTEEPAQPKEAQPPSEEPEETPEEYTAKLRGLVERKNIDPTEIEGVVRNYESFSDFKAAVDNDRDGMGDRAFTNDRTAMRYAEALFDAQPHLNATFEDAGLTKYEQSVARRLLDGDSLRKAALQLGTSHEKVRQVGAQIRAKLAAKYGVDVSDVLKKWDQVIASSQGEAPKTVQFGELQAEKKTKEGKLYTQSQTDALMEQVEKIQQQIDADTKSGKIDRTRETHAARLAEIYRQLEEQDSLTTNGEREQPPSVYGQPGSGVQARGGTSSPSASPAPASAGEAAASAAGPPEASSANPPNVGRAADATAERGQAGSNQLSPQEQAPDEVAEVKAALQDAKAKGHQVDASAEELLAEVDRQADARAHEAVYGSQRPGGNATAPDGTTTHVPGAEPGSPIGEPAVPGGNPVRANGTGPRTEPVPAGDGGVPDSLIRPGLADFFKSEQGFVDLDTLRTRVQQMYEKVKAMFGEASDMANKLSGKHFPSTAGENRVVAEKMGLVAGSPEMVRRAIPRVIDKVLGPKATEDTRRMAGAVLTELNLRQTKAFYLDRARNASNAGVAEQQKGVAGNKEAMKSYFDEADEAGKIARDVKSVLTQDDSPIKTEADYQAALADPSLKAILEAYKANFVDPIMEPNYAMSQGLSDVDDIKDGTQHPRYPVNLMAVGDELQPGEVPPVGAAGRGNLKNVQQKYNVFANQRHGNADAYELDLGKIMDNSMRRTDALAKRADLDRTIVKEELGQWGRQSQRDVEVNGKKAIEAPFVRPPKGTSQAAPGETSLYLDPDIYDDYRQLLGVDKPFSIPIVTPLSRIPAMATLASGVEAVYHAKNLLTGFMKPGMNPIDLFKNGYNLIRNDPATTDKIIELARIDAMRSQHEGGVFSRLIGPEANKYDPTFYMGKMLNILDSAVRLTASDAIDRLKAQGRIEGTDLERADFVNQIAGNYNRRSSSQLVNFLRDTGIGPFATAGTNYYMQGLRSLIADPGVAGKTFNQSLGLRAEVIARTVGALGAVALANYFAWGRPDGDDATPLGSIKLGNTADGRTLHFGLANIITGLPRGARETGLLAGIEGARQGQTLPHIIDKAQDDAVTSFVHPFAGPAVQFGYTAATGKDMLGRKVAQAPEPGGSVAVQNLKAAVLQANPIVANLTAPETPGRETTVTDRVLNQLGPFGPKTAVDPAVHNYYSVLDDAKAAQKAAKPKGGIITGDNAKQYRAALLVEKQMEVLSNALKGKRNVGGKSLQGPPPDDGTKARIRALQIQLARRVLSLQQ